MVFDLGEPVDQDGELIVLIFVGDLQAGLFDVAKTHTQAFARSSEPLSGVLHGMMLFRLAPVRPGIDKKPFGKMVPLGSNYSRREAKESSDKK